MPNVSRAFGGPTESLIGYARAAATQDLTVEVAAPGVAAEDRDWLQEALPDTTRLHEFASVGHHAWVVAPGLWVWLVRHASRYDVIHVHGLFNPVSSLSARIAVSTATPTVMRPFGTLSRYTFSRRSALKQFYFRLLDRPALRQADAIHFTTEAEREEASRFDLALEGRSHIVPPPWRGNAVRSDDDKTAHPTVLFMSRLHPKKNVKGLLEAWAQVVASHPDAELIVAGSGAEAYVQLLHETVAALDLHDNVSFAGFVTGTEKQRLLASSWAFALPSHQENFGVAVLEAIAAGLPVVISDAVQLRAFVEAHDLGLITDRTPDTIAAALQEGLACPDWRAACAARGPEAVAETFSLEAVGQQLVEMYRAVWGK
jgi:glycosyltransferase involved in cell wall biosynthesis